MRLREYAQKIGVQYKTAWLWWKQSKIKGYQLDSGTIIITEGEHDLRSKQKVAIYARVSSQQNREILEQQVERLVAYCAAKGYQVHHIIKEIGSGINDQRPKLINLLKDHTVTTIVVEHRDRLTRFGFTYLDTLLTAQGRSIEVVNLAENSVEDLLQDMINIVSSSCIRLYGQRRAKQKIERIIAELQANGKAGD